MRAPLRMFLASFAIACGGTTADVSGNGDAASASPVCSCASLASCAKPSTGIYGTTMGQCVSENHCQTAAETVPSCDGLYVRADSDAGAVTDLTSTASGVYSMPLAPGAYHVCCAPTSAACEGSATCVDVEVASGQALEIDALFTYGLGGQQCSMTKS